jgi:hypothetical protein
MNLFNIIALVFLASFALCLNSFAVPLTSDDLKNPEIAESYIEFDPKYERYAQLRNLMQLSYLARDGRADGHLVVDLPFPFPPVKVESQTDWDILGTHFIGAMGRQMYYVADTSYEIATVQEALGKFPPRNDLFDLLFRNAR